ncbi:tRNA(m(1)G37)methyltransferase [Dimargaris cristalligena]|nr:tRNA(m(1)G37)methyltransferase [Dimargaris cristalligena]
MLAPPRCLQSESLIRDAFQLTVKVLALRVLPQQVGSVTKQFAANLFNQPRLRNVVNDGEGKGPPGVQGRRLNALTPSPSQSTSAATKLVLLNQSFQSPQDLPTPLLDWAQREQCDTCEYELQLGYDYWQADDILGAILPTELPPPTSFETVGHIAHMNLRDEYLPYRHLIGQVILDKARKITTVVNKLDSIDTTFRFFKMEVLAGTDDMLAEVKESGCRFQFDFSKVYWNSRLHTEHDRLVQRFQPGDYICDVFGGVGPFALPAAKRGCYVYANDLNPESFKWLQANIRTNKLDRQIKPFNLDGRAFIREAFDQLRQQGRGDFKPYQSSTQRQKAARQHLKQIQQSEGEGAAEDGDQKVGQEPTAPASVVPDADQRPFYTFQHVVMNLPATAIEFLDAFKGIFYGFEDTIREHKIAMPFIHVHCFTKCDEPEKDLFERISSTINHELTTETPNAVAHFVRKVAPNKDMYCVTFQLPEAVAFASLKRKSDEV